MYTAPLSKHLSDLIHFKEIVGHPFLLTNTSLLIIVVDIEYMLDLEE